MENESIIIDNKEYKYIYKNGKKEKLGKGGGGEVFLVEHKGKEYALKRYKIKGRKGRRVENEFDFYKKKPNDNYIVKVYGTEQRQGAYYLLMQRYTCSFREIISRELSINKKFDYMFQLISAVKYIHGESVIHRDLKPENILVDDEGKLRLTDFGIAHFSDKPHITRPNQLLANKSYIAPELYNPGIKNYATACDIFSLGKIIVELFTGVNPGGTDQQLISDLYPELAMLDRVMAKMMRQDPKERPSISDVEIELKYIYNQIKLQKEELLDELKDCCGIDIITKDENAILQAAALDLMKANVICRTAKMVECVNINYHSNIHWMMCPEVRNYYYQIMVLKEVEKKFFYESNVYKQNTGSYTPINPLEKDKDLYVDLENILDRVKRIPFGFEELSGKIKKYFISCERYHCKEIIARIKDSNFIRMNETELMDMPIMYFVKYYFPVVTAYAGVECNSIEELIDINIEASSKNMENNALFFKKSFEVLEKLRTRYNCSIDSESPEYCLLKFTEEDYNTFRKDLELHFQNDDIRKYDVQDILKTEKNLGGVVEIKAYRDYDINSIIKKVVMKG